MLDLPNAPPNAAALALRAAAKRRTLLPKNSAIDSAFAATPEATMADQNLAHFGWQLRTLESSFTSHIDPRLMWQNYGGTRPYPFTAAKFSYEMRLQLGLNSGRLSSSRLIPPTALPVRHAVCNSAKQSTVWPLFPSKPVFTDHDYKCQVASRREAGQTVANQCNSSKHHHPEHCSMPT